MSWGAGCAKPGKYGVYTSVGAFADWVRSRTGLALAAAAPAPSTPDTPPSETSSEEAPASQPSAPDQAQTSTSDEAPAVPPKPVASPPPRGDRALVVGIDRYADPAFTDLRGAARDAHNIRWLLAEHLGFAPERSASSPTRRPRAKASSLGFETGWWPALARGRGRCSTSRATATSSATPMATRRTGYDEALVPHDARLVSDETRPMEVANLILDDEMGAMLGKLRGREVHVIVDSCHAGTMTRSLLPSAADPRYVRTLGLGMRTSSRRSAGRATYARSTAAARQRESGFVESEDDVTVWTAVSPLQLALEDREAKEPQGVFTRRFVRGIAERLADRDGDGSVVHAELLDYIRSQSTEYCSRHPRDCETGLTPTLEGPRDLLIADVATGAAVGGASEAAADGALGHANAAGVQLEIRPSARVRVGESVTYRVRSGRTGHLLLVDVAADGTVTQLFPNRFSERAGEDAAIGAGRIVEIPNAYYGFRLVASPPLGRGNVFAVITEDPISLDDLLGPNRDLRPVANARDWILALGERLRTPWLTESGTREPRWSAARIEYEIVQ